MNLGISSGLVLLTCAASAAAQPNVNSANFLMSACRASLQPGTSRDPVLSGYCTGLVAGLKAASPKICEPNGVTNEQAVRVVVAYIDRIPGRMHEPFIDLAFEALSAAWPCKR